MTPKISPTSLRELADRCPRFHIEDEVFQQHLRAAADCLEAYECLQVSTHAAHESLKKELDAAKARNAKLKRLLEDASANMEMAAVVGVKSLIAPAYAEMWAATHQEIRKALKADGDEND